MQLRLPASVRKVVAFVLVAGCLAPMLAPITGAASVSASSERGGILHLTKDCSQDTGLAGSFCTIMSSNLESLEVGSRIVYLQASSADGSIDSDIVIHIRPGNNTVFGHCDWPATDATGLCTLSGGTGRFTHFHAREVVALISGNLYSWDGPYSFGPRD
jgi:hypothetical protein